MKVTIKHDTIEHGAGMMRKGKQYHRLTFEVHAADQERQVIERGGLTDLILCEMPPPVHEVDFPTKQQKEMIQLDMNPWPGTITGGFARGSGTSCTFRSLLAARNFEAALIAGVRKLKEAIESDTEVPFQAERTIEI
jgi:hypothetical protein